MSSVVPLFLAAALIATPVSAASILLGTDTLDTADDLTVIQTEGGELWEWLDLSATDGISIADAVANYGADGFRWATGADVSELFSAFGFTYAIAPSNFALLGADFGEQSLFNDLLGLTSFGSDPFLPELASLGWIDDLTSDTHMTYACLSGDDGCSASVGFVNNTTFFRDPHHQIGVFMVRDKPTVVSEPNSFLLLIAVSGFLALSRRRRAH